MLECVFSALDSASGFNTQAREEHLRLLHDERLHRVVADPREQE